MLSVQEIKTFIENDLASDAKQQAQIGERYYKGEHDIVKKRIFFIDSEKVLKEDLTKANTRISHPFFMENVDQTVQYLFSGDEPIIKSDDLALQTVLDERFNANDEFMAQLYNVVEGSAIKGFEYAYLYKDDEGITRMECADSLGVVKVRKEATDDRCEYVIRHYTDTVEKDSKAIRRIEVWDEQQTTFYVQEDEGEVRLDESKEHNPRPHTLLKKKGDEKIYFESFGFIPFVELPYNKYRASGLRPIKDLIDDYDEMNCGLSNMILDTAEALYVVTGFEGDDLDELMENIKAKKHIGVDENGGVEIKTIDIPVEARKAKMDEDKRNIYHFGQAFNTEGLKDTAATTNLAIEMGYSLLEMKRVKLVMQVRKFLHKIVEIILDEINKTQKTNYGMKDVYFNFKKKPPVNEKETEEVEMLKAQKRQLEINTILNLQAVIGDEKVLELVAEQLDIDYEELKAQAPQPEEDDQEAARAALESIETVDAGGGVIE